MAYELADVLKIDINALLTEYHISRLIVLFSYTMNKICAKNRAEYDAMDLKAKQNYLQNNKGKPPLEYLVRYIR